MKYKDRDNLVAGLREAANFVEVHGLQLPLKSYETDCKITSYLLGSEIESRALLRKVAKIMGRAEKDHSGSHFHLRKRFGPVSLEFISNRNAVCTPIVVGKKVLPAIEATPEREVDDVEWVCTDPLLKESA